MAQALFPPWCHLVFLLISLPFLPPSVTALEDRTPFLFMWQRSLFWSVGDALVHARMNCLCCDDFSLSIPLPRLVFLHLPFPCAQSLSFLLQSSSLASAPVSNPGWPPLLALAVPGGSSPPSSPGSECLNTGVVVSGRGVWISLPYSLSHKLSSAFSHSEQQQ